MWLAISTGTPLLWVVSGCGVLFIVTAWMTIRLSERRLWRIQAAIYRIAQRHIEQGCEMLRPPDICGVDAATKLVRLHKEADLMVITRLGWKSRVVRQYRIDSSGNITRRLILLASPNPDLSPKPRLSDWVWCYRPLTIRRMRYLHRAMQGWYSPRTTIQFGRKRDYAQAS